MLIAIVVIMLLGFAGVVTLIVGVALSLADVHAALEIIMGQMEDLTAALDSIGTDVDEALAHTTELTTELAALQKQIDDNQAPDLSMVIAKAQAIKAKLEGASSTASDPSSAASGGGTQPMDTLPGGETAKAPTDGTTQTTTVGDAADGDVVSQPGNMPAEQTSGTAPGTGDASASTSHDTEATNGSQSAADQMVAGSAPSEQPQEAAAEETKGEDFDPEAQARDPQQG